MPVRTTGRPAAWILTGLLAVLLVVAAQFLDAPGLLERRATWWRPMVQLPAHLLLLLAWWQLGPGYRRPLLAASIWSLPLLFVLPLHSRDAYSYAAQGWLMAHGQNPYLVPSGDAGTSGLLVGVHWFETTSVYPSLSLEIFGLVARLFDFHPHWAAVGMRLPNVVAFVVLAWAVAKLAGHYGVSRRLAWWWGVANPILLVQWVGGVHNDALMIALVAVAAVLMVRRDWWSLALGGIALGLGMGIKQSAALAGLGLVAVAWESRLRDGRRGWWRLLGTAVVPGSTTIVTFLVVSLASGLGFGWTASTAGNPISATSNAPLSWVASFGRYHELAEVETVNATVTTVSLVLMVGAIVALYVWIGPKADDAGRPWLFLILSLLTFGALGPALQPWYLTWIIPFYAFAKLRDEWRLAWWLLLAGFTMLPPLQDLMPPYVAMGVVAVPLLGFVWWWRRRAAE